MPPLYPLLREGTELDEGSAFDLVDGGKWWLLAGADGAISVHVGLADVCADGAASADAVIRTQAFRARGFDPGFSYAEGVAADRLWSWKYEMMT